MDSHDHAAGSAAAQIRGLDLHGGVGAPIIVGGRLWGAAIVGTSRSEPLPPGTEARVADFTDLVATAISNAATRTELEVSRDELRVLAEQQAALRRVATLVARGVAPSEVFEAVADEMARCLRVMHATVSRYDADHAFIPLAMYTQNRLRKLPESLRLPLEDDNVATRVFRSGRTARMDSHDDAPGTTPRAYEKWASVRRWESRSSSASAYGARPSSARRHLSRCRRTPRRASATSPIWSRPRSLMRPSVTNYKPAAVVSPSSQHSSRRCGEWPH